MRLYTLYDYFLHDWKFAILYYTTFLPSFNGLVDSCNSSIWVKCHTSVSHTNFSHYISPKRSQCFNLFHSALFCQHLMHLESVIPFSTLSHVFGLGLPQYLWFCFNCQKLMFSSFILTTLSLWHRYLHWYAGYYHFILCFISVHTQSLPSFFPLISYHSLYYSFSFFPTYF